MHELHVEGWQAEHNGCGHPRQVQEGERGDGEEHRRGYVGGSGLQHKHMRHDDAAVTASDKEHYESRQAAARNEHGLQAGNETGENSMQERQERGTAGGQRGGKKEKRNLERSLKESGKKEIG